MWVCGSLALVSFKPEEQSGESGLMEFSRLGRLISILHFLAGAILFLYTPANAVWVSSVFLDQKRRSVLSTREKYWLYESSF